jgi:hypothetical protein
MGKVEDGSDAGVTVLGDTVNFAARLQALAEPDTVIMSAATHRLVQGMVEATFAGDHQIKGKAEAQGAYWLGAVRQGAARFDAAVSRGLSTFVGREHELEVLERSLDEARTQLRVIDLVAEPGMGNRACCMSFASASAMAAPSFCLEVVRPTASRHRSCPLLRSFADRFRSAPAKLKGKSRANWKWG